MTCAREGCNRKAVGDDYCSTYCARRAMGTLVASGLQAAEPADARDRRNTTRRRRRIGGAVTVENTDAMTRAVSGGFEQGKRT